MKKFLLPLIIAQVFTLNAFAEKQEQNNRVRPLHEPSKNHIKMR